MNNLYDEKFGFTLTCNRCGSIKEFNFGNPNNNDYIDVVIDMGEVELFCDCGNLIFWSHVYGGR